MVAFEISSYFKLVIFNFSKNDNHYSLGEYYYSFTGIPYATPPVSNMRFQEVEPRLGWHGDLDATQNKNACPR